MKKNVALLAGGDSGEYQVSLNSAAMVEASLDKVKYNVYTIYIYGSDWYYKGPDGKKHSVDKNDFSLDLSGGRVLFDVVFMMIHGTPGEDGRLQGYFEMLGLPCTNSDLFTSSLTFNKYFTNQQARMWGIMTPFSRLLTRGAPRDLDGLAGDVGFPCFVKPNCGGSSLGTTRVNEKSQLKKAIEDAFAVGDQVLVEEYIGGTEVTCGLIRYGEETLVFPLTEIVPKNEFFDYEAKYTVGMADEITPARIPEEAAIEVKRLSSFLYNKLLCRGIVRVDFILRGDEFYFIELNTVPGMSEPSIVPQQIRAAGMKETEIFSLAIENALKGHG